MAVHQCAPLVAAADVSVGRTVRVAEGMLRTSLSTLEAALKSAKQDGKTFTADAAESKKKSKGKGKGKGQDVASGTMDVDGSAMPSRSSRKRAARARRRRAASDHFTAPVGAVAASPDVATPLAADGGLVLAALPSPLSPVGLGDEWADAGGRSRARSLSRSPLRASSAASRSSPPAAQVTRVTTLALAAVRVWVPRVTTPQLGLGCLHHAAQVPRVTTLALAVVLAWWSRVTTPRGGGRRPLTGLAPPAGDASGARPSWPFWPLGTFTATCLSSSVGSALFESVIRSCDFA